VLDITQICKFSKWAWEYICSYHGLWQENQYTTTGTHLPPAVDSINLMVMPMKIEKLTDVCLTSTMPSEQWASRNYELFAVGWCGCQVSLHKQTLKVSIDNYFNMCSTWLYNNQFHLALSHIISHNGSESWAHIWTQGTPILTDVKPMFLPSVAQMDCTIRFSTKIIYW